MDFSDWATLVVAVLALISSFVTPLWVVKVQRRHQEGDKLADEQRAEAKLKPSLAVQTWKDGNARTVNITNVGDDDAVEVRIELIPADSGRAFRVLGKDSWERVSPGQSVKAKVAFAGGNTRQIACVIYEDASGRSYQEEIEPI